MPDFSTHDIKTVEELYDPDQVNRYLKDGWVLLSAGFETMDDGPCKVYILGNTNFIDPHAIDRDNPLAEVCKM